MRPLVPGVVHISPKVASGTVGDNFVLMHIPTDRMLVLYEHGQAIWESLSTDTSVDSLVKAHAARVGVPMEVASYQTITFLDELRTMGIVDFVLDKEREGAPLLDTSLGVSDLKAGDLLGHIVRGSKADPIPLHDGPVLIAGVEAESTLTELFERYVRRRVGDESGDEKGGSTKGQPAIFVQNRPDLTIGELAALPKTVARATGGKRVRLMTIEGEVPAVELKRLAEASPEALKARPEITSILDDPRPDTTVGSLPKPSVGMARLVVVVVIVLGPIIIIIIFYPPGGPGPTWGKSRSACKTVCV